MASSAAIRQLRTDLEKRFGGAILPAPGATISDAPGGIPSGIEAIDMLLPKGLPRGAVTLWTGTGTSGRTGVLYATVIHAVRTGYRVGVIDASRALDAQGWAEADGAIFVRPPEPVASSEGAWAAEMLLNSGVFDLVVLDSELPGGEQVHRLRAHAKERNVALLLNALASASSVRPDVHLEFTPHLGAGEGLLPGGRYRRGVRVRRLKGGGLGGPAERELRLSYTPTGVIPAWSVPDRSVGGGWGGRGCAGGFVSEADSG